MLHPEPDKHDLAKVDATSDLDIASKTVAAVFVAKRFLQQPRNHTLTLKTPTRSL